MEQKTPLTGRISTVFWATFKISIATFNADRFLALSLERRPLALNTVLKPMIWVWRGSGE